MWLDLGYSHFLKILPFVQHIRIRLDLVALGLVIAHFLSSRRVWTQFLMLPFLKIFGKIFAIVASGEEWSISWLRIVILVVVVHWTYVLKGSLSLQRNCSWIFCSDVSRIFSFRAVLCELSCFLLSPPYDPKVNFPARLTSDSNWWIRSPEKSSDCYCFWWFSWPSISLYRGWLDRPYWFHKQIHSIPHFRSRTRWDKYE